MMKNHYRVILIFSNCMTHLVKTYYPYHFWPDWPSEATKAIAKPEYEMQCAMRNKCIRHPSVEKDLCLKIEVRDQTIWKSTQEL